MRLKLLLCLILGVFVVAFSGCTDSPAEDGDVESISYETSDNEKAIPSQVQDSGKPSKYIDLKYGDDGLYRKIGYSTPSPGNKYLVTRLDIENHGYDEFYVNPNYFRALVNGVEYGYSSATFGLEDINLRHLQTVTLRTGGATSGYIVFELPESDTVTYKIIDTRQGMYKFEYGHIPEIKTEPEPEPVIRELSFYLSNRLFNIDEENLAGEIGGDSYRTTVDTRQAGIVNQVTRVDRESGFVVVGIKTSLTEETRPVDESKAIEDALNEAEDYVCTNHRINKGRTYERTLPSGQSVDIQFWEAPSGGLLDGEANVCCFMPDDCTVVTIVTSLTNQVTEKFFETLEIGDLPQS